ncbi:MAG TPA: hypothetical protein PKK67_11185 [Cyclobacteriaceae bacterium]|nr:hypothetical protein [Cyclobacteriaceae bacterium]
MKTIIFILLAFVSFQSFGQEADTLQINSSTNEIDLGDTDLTLILLPRQHRDYSVTIKFPSDMTGTVQINAENGVMTTSHTYSAGDLPCILTGVRNKFWIKFSDPAGECWIEL